jgi:hypothetical protein
MAQSNTAWPNIDHGGPAGLGENTFSPVALRCRLFKRVAFEK